MSIAISFFGVFSFATCTIINPIGPHAGDHDDVVELDVAAIHRVDRAGQRLDDRGVVERHVGGDLVDQRGGRNPHVLRHAAVGHLALESRRCCAPRTSSTCRAAIAAAVAGDDLLGDHAIARRDAEMLGRALAQRST
jgi:hypothetical protein